MGWLLALASFAFAVVSTLGAWTVVRRRKALFWTFLASAALLTIGGVAAAYRLPETWLVLAAGSLTSSFASYWNARTVFGSVVARNHLARAAAGVALVLVAAWRFA